MTRLISGSGRSGEASACAWMREQRTRRGMRVLLSIASLYRSIGPRAWRLVFRGTALGGKTVRKGARPVPGDRFMAFFGQTKPISCKSFCFMVPESFSACPTGKPHRLRQTIALGVWESSEILQVSPSAQSDIRGMKIARKRREFGGPLALWRLFSMGRRGGEMRHRRRQRLRMWRGVVYRSLNRQILVLNQRFGISFRLRRANQPFWRVARPLISSIDPMPKGYRAAAFGKTAWELQSVPRDGLRGDHRDSVECSSSGCRSCRHSIVLFQGKNSKSCLLAQHLPSSRGKLSPISFPEENDIRHR